jgi:hypothetical protein
MFRQGSSNARPDRADIRYSQSDQYAIVECGFDLLIFPAMSRDAWDENLRRQLDHRHRLCNFVEIMPRLEEDRRWT